ncbi:MULTISPECIES: hypothetical protein [unclassified Lentimonas]|uniref:hypothetical protein n=1 Tax=unclassified Lentimonas TaxID=2630993 RepID=UPI0013283169|nr:MULTISPECIES: hypothetical protein [unclassified Lentimonas]CAA6676236.1 Unannotated [Lentimonas sp. CC4]CAA6687388.1 Unannotated [Lentimonas sp. CC6]CAA6691507.1 Unannotated [Lentimonas sp. CC19]CAA6697367.1 Unannotated [Lentimonas sp. CC10]CAA7072366.1 Unannotated [Lentimonas sp. CC11]
MSKAKKRPDLTSLMGGAVQTSGATPKAEPTPAPTPEPKTVEISPETTPAVASTSTQKREVREPEARRAPTAAEKRPTPAKRKPATPAKKKKSDDYMMTSIAFDADDMLDLQDVAMCFMRESRSLKYPTRNMVAKVGIKAAHILSQEDPERLLELFEMIRSKDRRYSENRD